MPGPKRTTVVILIALLWGPLAWAGGEINGTIITDRGESFTGPIRWDKNENYWDDTLDASKEEPVVIKDEEDSGFTFLGLRLPIFGDNETHIYSRFSIPFGHIQAIEPRYRGDVLIALKNGDSHYVKPYSTDLGAGMRGLVVEDSRKGRTEITWDDVERVEFSAGAARRDGERLYGTLETEGGNFTGFIVWDRDESMLEDALDGEADGEDRKILFREIGSIEKSGRRASRVTLHDGTTLLMEGTNDVNADNRGISVRVPGLGLVETGWEEFQRLTLKSAPASPGYDDFDGGRRLQGKVTTASGSVHHGRITWDNDEEYSWETLDGDVDGLDYAIPFSHIVSITRESDDEARVLLSSGDELVLGGSNDVNEENKGIRIEDADGLEVELGWGDFQALELKTGS